LDEEGAKWSFFLHKYLGIALPVCVLGTLFSVWIYNVRAVFPDLFAQTRDDAHLYQKSPIYSASILIEVGIYVLSCMFLLRFHVLFYVLAVAVLHVIYCFCAYSSSHMLIRFRESILLKKEFYWQFMIILTLVNCLLAISALWLHENEQNSLSHFWTMFGLEFMILLYILFVKTTNPSTSGSIKSIL
jgi:hypothetical protein